MEINDPKTLHLFWSVLDFSKLFFTTWNQLIYAQAYRQVYENIY